MNHGYLHWRGGGRRFFFAQGATVVYNSGTSLQAPIQRAGGKNVLSDF